MYALIAWSVVRYRRKGKGLPPQTHYNVPVELTYTLIPLLIVGLLFFLTVRTQRSILEVGDNPDLVVEATGFRWQWRFHYPGHGVTETGVPGHTPTLVVPRGRTVRFELTTADVIHSFYVPQFLAKHDAIPGRVIAFEVRPRRTGRFRSGRCAEFCGIDHDKMRFDVEVVEPGEFREWVAGKRAGGPPIPVVPGAAAMGRTPGP